MRQISPLRVAVVGLGQMGTVHARVFHQHPLANLVAVADIDPSRVRQVADSLGAKSYKDYLALLDSEEFDSINFSLINCIFTRKPLEAKLSL